MPAVGLTICCVIAHEGTTESKLSPPGWVKVMEFRVTSVAVSLVSGDHLCYDALNAVDFIRGCVAQV